MGVGRRLSHTFWGLLTQNADHIPHADSKITLALKEAFGGNCFTRAVFTLGQVRGPFAVLSCRCCADRFRFKIARGSGGPGQSSMFRPGCEAA